MSIVVHHRSLRSQAVPLALLLCFIWGISNTIDAIDTLPYVFKNSDPRIRISINESAHILVQGLFSNGDVYDREYFELWFPTVSEDDDCDETTPASVASTWSIAGMPKNFSFTSSVDVADGSLREEAQFNVTLPNGGKLRMVFSAWNQTKVFNFTASTSTTIKYNDLDNLGPGWAAQFTNNMSIVTPANALKISIIVDNYSVQQSQYPYDNTRACFFVNSKLGGPVILGQPNTAIKYLWADGADDFTTNMTSWRKLYLTNWRIDMQFPNWGLVNSGAGSPTGAASDYWYDGGFRYNIGFKNMIGLVDFSKLNQVQDLVFSPKIRSGAFNRSFIYDPDLSFAFSLEDKTGTPPSTPQPPIVNLESSFSGTILYIVVGVCIGVVVIAAITAAIVFKQKRQARFRRERTRVRASLQAIK